MIYVVYMPKSDTVTRDTMVAVFLMQCDAERFVAKALIDNLQIKEVDNWASWTAIRKSALDL